MRNAAVRDVVKVWIFAGVVIGLTAWISPLVYNAGKALAEVSGGKQTNGFLKWLGEFCAGATLVDFYVMSLVGWVVVLFVPFSEGLALRRAGRAGEAGQRLRWGEKGILDLGTGLLMAMGVILLVGYGLVMVGAFRWLGVGDLPDWKGVAKGVGVAAAGVVAQEVLFRGVVLGIFLRGMRAGWAIGLAALLFAVVRVAGFPEGVEVADPDAGGVGFELLGLAVARLGDPVVWMSEVLPVLAMGWILGYARWRTASLWLPVGLHGGWLLANGLFSAATKAVRVDDRFASMLANESLSKGLIPFAGLLLIGALVYFFTETRQEEVG